MILATAVLAGTLCIDTAPCVATSANRATVAPAAEARRYVWTNDDRTLVALGTIEPHATEIALHAGTSRPLRIQMRERAAIAFELGSWRWTITNPPPAIRLLHPPCDGCVLKATAEGFRPFEKPLRDTTDVALHPWPNLQGRVVDAAEGTPLAGATISILGKLLAKTETDGTFDVRVEQDWPRAIEVAWPGRAPRRVELPRAATDTDLDDIALSAGGGLRVRIDPPIQQKLTWELREPRWHELVQQGEIDAGATDVAIDGLAEGKHGFVLRGERPLQQFETAVEIKNEQVTKTSITIQPMKLELAVTHRAEPLAGAKVYIHFSMASWRGEITLDGDGRAAEELWQRGVVNAMVYLGERKGYSTAKRLESDEATWQITVPDRRITGRLLDAATGEPLREARVGINVEHDKTSDMPGRAHIWAVPIDHDGRYTFDAIDPGVHELQTFARGYVNVEDVQVVVGDAAGAYEQDILLHRPGKGRTLILTDEHGLPVPDAAVFLGDANGLREVAATGLDGRCIVPLGAGDRGVIFAVPRSGSFAFLRVGPQRGDDDTIPMRVRSGSAVIDVEARDSDGKPLANVVLALRVNGMLLPADVMISLLNRQGLRYVTDANGRARLAGMPPGVYELWAITGRDQRDALRSGNPPPPAASLEVVSGRYGVAIDFAARGGN